MKIIALAGGVGGAKLADGLYAELAPGELTVIVNTADDVVLHGLHVSPDLDTVLYTLAGLANPETGWGIAGDTFNSLDMLARYGGPSWFRLGDRDLATHITRTTLLREGSTLTEATAHLAASLGLRAALLPMADQRVETIIATPEGDLAFQEYFVHRGCRDQVLGIRLHGIETTRRSFAIDAALDRAEAIVICPSNPLVSVGPILAVAGLRAAIRARGLPVVAVSPIIGGQAVRGPAARMMESLGMEVTPAGVARLYSDLRPALFIDNLDAHLAAAVASAGARPVVAPILMQTNEDRRALARRVLEEIARGRPPAGDTREHH